MVPGVYLTTYFQITVTNYRDVWGVMHYDIMNPAINEIY